MANTYGEVGATYGQAGGTYGAWGSVDPPTTLPPGSIIVGVRRHTVEHHVAVDFSVTLATGLIAVHEAEPASSEVTSTARTTAASVLTFTQAVSLEARVETASTITTRPQFTSAARIASEARLSPSTTVMASRRTGDLLSLVVAVAALENR